MTTKTYMTIHRDPEDYRALKRSNVLVTIGLLVALFAVARLTVQAQEVPTVVDCAQHFVVAKTLDGCGDVLGHGVTYGQRGERRSITVWDCPAGLVVELTEYGEPTSNLNSTGPVIGKAVLPPAVVTWLQGQVCDG